MAAEAASRAKSTLIRSSDQDWPWSVGRSLEDNAAIGRPVTAPLAKGVHELAIIQQGQIRRHPGSDRFLVDYHLVLTVNDKPVATLRWTLALSMSEAPIPWRTTCSWHAYRYDEQHATNRHDLLQNLLTVGPTLGKILFSDSCNARVQWKLGSSAD